MSVNQMPLNKALRLILIFCVSLTLIVGWFGIAALTKTTHAATEMGTGKDLVADILPPPLFIIESQLTAYDISEAQPDHRQPLIEKLQQLHKDYDTRNQYWESSALDASLKEKLLGEQRKHADAFWKEIDSTFLPAVVANDQAQINASLKKLRTAYEAHRAGVEMTVDGGNKFAEATLNGMNSTSQNSSMLMIAAVTLGGFLIFWVLFRLRQSLNQRIGGEPGDAVTCARRIADGDLNGEIRFDPAHNESMLAAMSQMQGNLKVLINDIQKVVMAAEAGDFSQRIDIKNKQGFGLDIAQALNQLLTTTGNSLNDISNVATALSLGDLSQKVQPSYPGTFGQTADAVNQTVDTLSSLLEEIASVVDNASSGNLSTRVRSENKSGFGVHLAEEINRLNNTTEAALKDIARVANRLADGDLTETIQTNYPGLFGETSGAINETVRSLQTLIQDIEQAVNAITIAAREIASGNSDLSARTEQQASSLEETASSMEEFTSTAQNNTHSATEATALAKNAANIAREGGEVVKSSASTMLEIQAGSRKIQDIISVIEGIAFQTNILALNAAVEAARAGEQGKGFAVVATEVRALAHRSAQAAKEIAVLISTSGEQVEHGTRQAKQAGDSMSQIIEAIVRVSSIVENISSATKEQTTGIEQVNTAISQMDSATQQNAALVEQAAAAAESLEEQARSLEEQIQRFKLSNQSKTSKRPTPMLTNQAAAPKVAKRPALPTPPKALPSTLEDEWSEF